mgnify:CR=1 FL=1
MKLIATLIAASLFAHATLAASPVEVDRIVAVVNSEPVTNSEVMAVRNRLLRELNARGAPMPPDKPI